MSHLETRCSHSDRLKGPVRARDVEDVREVDPKLGCVFRGTSDRDSDSVQTVIQLTSDGVAAALRIVSGLDMTVPPLRLRLVFSATGFMLRDPVSAGILQWASEIPPSRPVSRIRVR